MKKSTSEKSDQLKTLLHDIRLKFRFRRPSLEETTVYVQKHFQGEIHDAAKQYDLNPNLITAILVYEIHHINIWDKVQHVGAQILIMVEGRFEKIGRTLWGIFAGERIGKQSFGIAQMNVDTLRDLVEDGYFIPSRTISTDLLDHLLDILLNSKNAPNLVGAPVRKTIDHWHSHGVDISHRHDICCTLYSIGLTGVKGVHESPQPSDVGLQIVDLIHKIQHETELPA